MEIFEPHLQTPYAQSWTFGIQRELGRSMALEIRYVGTKGLQTWNSYNYNSTDHNMLENGVLEEFKLAMLNLQANVANGKASSGFKYLGPNTGTVPLPISLAWFNGSTDANNPARYSGSNWTSSTNLGYLNRRNPNPSSYAAALHSDSTKRANGLAAGMPANFFMANPDLRGGAVITGNGGWSRYDSMAIELRRRMSKGILLQANYVWAKGFDSSFVSLRRERVNDLAGTLPHTFKLNWVIELPFGSGRRFASSSGRLLDRIIGGWDFHGIFRVQTGDRENFGTVQLVGMTPEELQNVYKLRFDDANRVIYQLPDDIIQNTILAHSFDPTSLTGYTDDKVPTGRYFAPARSLGCIGLYTDECAPRNLYVRGAKWSNIDASLVKQIRFTETKNFELRAEFLNALNEVMFNYTTGCVGSDLDICRVTGDQNAPRRVQLVFRLNF
jgi:hypothetical protein